MGRYGFMEGGRWALLGALAMPIILIAQTHDALILMVCENSRNALSLLRRV